MPCSQSELWTRGGLITRSSPEKLRSYDCCFATYHLPDADIVPRYAIAAPSVTQDTRRPFAQKVLQHLGNLLSTGINNFTHVCMSWRLVVRAQLLRIGSLPPAWPLPQELQATCATLWLHGLLAWQGCADPGPNCCKQRSQTPRTILLQFFLFGLVKVQTLLVQARFHCREGRVHVMDHMMPVLRKPLWTPTNCILSRRTCSCHFVLRTPRDVSVAERRLIEAR